jgi:hypothetical protein
MLIPPLKMREPVSYGTAKRLRHQAVVAHHDAMIAKSVVMVTVLCETCDARFAISHLPEFQNVGLAEKQAVWLKDRFVWDHIQEQKHSGSIRLPAPHELP